MKIGKRHINEPAKTLPKKEKPSGEFADDLWTRRVKAALLWRRNFWNGDKNWTLAYKIYRGHHWDGNAEESNLLSSDSPNDRITVNITGSTILNLLPFLYNRRVEFVCTPRKPDSDVSAKIKQVLLNYVFETSDIQSEIKRAVLDSLIVGHGIIKTGYTIELDQAKSVSDGELSYEDIVKEDAPYAKRISPFLFLFDPSSPTRSLKSARWCAEIFFVSFEDLITNSKYDTGVINKIKSGVYELSKYSEVFPLETSDFTSDTFSNHLTSSSVEYSIPEDELVVCYEVWDKRFRKVRIFVDGCPEPIFEKNWPFEYLREFPYVMTEFIPIPDEPYGIGIPFLTKDQQLELNRVRSSMFAHRRKFNRKYQVSEEVKPEEAQKLAFGPDGTIIRVPQIGMVAPIADATINQDQLITEQYIKSDIQELTGSDALFRGGSLPSRTTAGEVSARTSFFRMKLDDRVEEIDNFIHKIGKQILKHIEGNFLTPKIVQIVGEQGAYWVDATSESIAAEVDLRMDSVAAPKSDPVLDRQQALQLLQIVSQFMPMVQQGSVKIDFNQLLKWILEKFGNKDVGRFFSEALIPNAPLKETPVTNNLNSQNVSGLPGINQETQDVNSVQQEGGLAAILNQSGLQL
jgi:hypothetical protein